MSVAGPDPRDLHLLDVLEQLPRDVLRTSIWQHLRAEEEPCSDTPSNTTGRPFRLGCRRSRRLADELTQRAELSCSDEDQEAHGTFLSRLDGLEQLSLTIEDVLDEGDTGENLIIRVLLLGGTTCRRLHTLKINTDGTLGAVGGHAVQVCCPSLRTLQLNTASVVLDFIQPLQACQSLAKVSVSGVSPDGRGCLDTSEVLLAMSHLTGLRAVSLGGYMAASNLAPLAALTGLRDLHLGQLEVRVEATYNAVHIGRVLGGLTQLTCLDTPDWDNHQGEAPQTSIESTLNGILAQLGGLRALASLTLHGYGPLQADSMAALCQLTALTHLDIPQMAEHPDCGTGHLPRLQKLTVQGVHSSGVLAASLQSFLPLGALREVSYGLRLGVLTGQADVDDGGLAVVDAFHFAAVLAAAPRLQAVSLTVRCHDPGPLLAAAAAVGVAALLPLQGLLTQVRMTDLPDGALESLLPVLCGASRLELLSMTRCRVPAQGLLWMVGRHTQALRHLCVCDCGGVTAATAEAIAAVPAHPLRVKWAPLAEESLAAFRAVARPGVTLVVDM